MKDKNRFIAFLLVVLVSLCAVLSAIFSGILLAKSENNSNTAYADELNYTYVYSQSNLFYVGASFREDILLEDPLYGFSASSAAYGSPRRFLSCNMSLDFSYDSEGYFLYMNKERLGIYSRTNYRYYDAYFYDYGDNRSSRVGATQIPSFDRNSFDFYDSVYHVYGIAVLNYDGGNNTYGVFQTMFLYTGSPDLSKLLYVDIYTVYREQSSYFEVCNVLEYTDFVGNKVVVLLYNPFYKTGDYIITESDLPAFEDRRYYLEYSISNEVSAADLLRQSSYERGYKDGKLDGEIIGDAAGYQRGSDAGYERGKSDGINEGIAQANNYSFLALIGAVIDAPVKAFTGLLNFDILGFNLLGFVTGLLTLALIIWIIYVILGKK